MATWKSKNSMLTKKGVEILNKLKAGIGSITVTRVVAGSERVAESLLYNQTSISGVNKDMTISFKNTTDVGSEISCYIDNSGFTDYYDLHQIGIYVTHPDCEGEQLYHISQCEANDFDTIPPITYTPVTQGYSIFMEHGNAEQVTITVDPMGMVSLKQFNAFKESSNSSFTEINSSLSEMNNAISEMGNSLSGMSNNLSEMNSNLSGMNNALTSVSEIANAAKEVTDSAGKAGGLATLDENGKLKEMPTANDVNAIPTSEKGVANGLATLDANGKLAQMPTADDVGATPVAHSTNKSNPHEVTAAQVKAIETSKLAVANGVATLDANKKLVQMPTFVDVGGINKNLLHNWYFKNPINSNGLTQYGGVTGQSGISFDRWTYYGTNITLTLTENGIVAASSSNQYQYIQQVIDTPSDLIGQKLVASFLASSSAKLNLGVFDYSNGTVGNCLKSISDYLANGSGILSCSFSVPSGTTKIVFLIYPNFTATEETVSTTLIAAKLEKGNVQTLAYQDSDGNWVLNEVPDYSEQSAICAQYDHTTKLDTFMGAAKPFSLIQNYTDSITLAISNMGNFIGISSESDLTVTIPSKNTVNFPIGAELEVCRYGIGAVTFAAAEGVIINSVDGARSISAQFACAALKKVADDVWLLSGSLE